MKKIFKNKKIYYIVITVIALLYIFMILKKGLSISYQYDVEYMKYENFIPFVPVISYIKGVLFDNLILMLICIGLLIPLTVLGENKKIKIIILMIFIIISIVLVPLKIKIYNDKIDYFNKENYLNSFIINTDTASETSPLFNIFDL